MRTSVLCCIAALSTWWACSSQPEQPQYEQPVQGITVKKTDSPAMPAAAVTADSVEQAANVK